MNEHRLESRHSEMMHTHDKIIVMSIKPKYAKAIFEGRKNWEFRKAPPPLFRTIYVYESAPVSKVTGVFVFSESITGFPILVMETVRSNRCFTENLTGISLKQLDEYAGDQLVTALRVHEARRFDEQIEFKPKPPQNWGTFYVPKNPDEE